ncbi:hypothetical protein A1O1_06711 [Capronia coronata CBS 617.96]|uniref:alpha-1,2-Mannosidase n=1 Tax=Capronia coronata CBS 617.96 TaxID=1182541 RepID=W9XS84_9EURO|nr:uncharacterized protein A1O1_06711 [Capronia coronata CBS 617.96]EXJ83093.1 hypothetical protein A1O1_06711 [Capronia coronata CBS 617.96]
MELPDVVDTILQHISSIDFPATELKISLSQASKTYMGGLLSAHELLTGPLSHLASNKSAVAALLTQAQTLADSLSFAFDTPSHLPQNNLLLKPRPKHRRVATTGITSIGTIALEWTHLTTLSQHQSYADLVGRAMGRLWNSKKGGQCEKAFPDFPGNVLSLKSGNYVSYEGVYVGGAGSFYEYLMKMYIYSPTEYSFYRHRWTRAVDATMKRLASHPSSRPDLTFLASINCTDVLYSSDHSAFFAAGNFILGGTVLHKPRYVDFGLTLVESQVELYRSTATGLGPDRYAWLPAWCNKHPSKAKLKANPHACQLPPECANQTDFYATAGYCVVEPKNMLRPEVLESLYYAYRATGNRKYQDMSWEIFQAMIRATRVSSGGFSQVADVNVMPENDGPGGRLDMMYGFFMAETIKYAYLIHVEEGEWHMQADGRNKWVFNSQAHPLRVRESVV